MDLAGLGYLMFIASCAAADRIFRAVHDAGCDDVTIAQSRPLMGIDADSTRLGALAKRSRRPRAYPGMRHSSCSVVNVCTTMPPRVRRLRDEVVPTS